MPNTVGNVGFSLKGCCFIGVLRWGWSSVVGKVGGGGKRVRLFLREII